MAKVSNNLLMDRYIRAHFSREGSMVKEFGRTVMEKFTKDHSQTTKKMVMGSTFGQIVPNHSKVSSKMDSDLLRV